MTILDLTHEYYTSGVSSLIWERMPTLGGKVKMFYDGTAHELVLRANRGAPSADTEILRFPVRVWQENLDACLSLIALHAP